MRIMPPRRLLPSLLCGIVLLSPPLPAMAQGCLGLPERPNTGAVGIGAGHQGDGQRIGVWGSLNAAGKFGLLAGVGFGEMDSFATGGYEARGMVTVPVFGAKNVCVFAEYEQAHQGFRRAMGMTRGDLTDYWIHFGYGVSGDLGRLAGLVFTLHLAPEVILRRTHIRGRSTHVEPEVHVLEHSRVWGDWYLGGRGMVSVRHSRYSFTWGLQNRPRSRSDLHWFLRIGYSI